MPDTPPPLGRRVLTAVATLLVVAGALALFARFVPASSAQRAQLGELEAERQNDDGPSA